MTQELNFENVARIIVQECPSITGERLVEATYRILDLKPPTPTALAFNLATHEGRVAFAVGNREVMDCVRDATNKIAPIKLFRSLTGCGLKESKEAIEDSRVWGAWHLS